MNWLRKLCVVAFAAMPLVGFADEGKFLVAPGPAADIASKWEASGKGKYLFTLDASKTVKGAPVTVEMIKSAVEGKKELKAMGAKVAKEGDKIAITYNGEDQAFLDALSKARVKPAGGDMVAIADSTSTGEMRARTGVREPSDDEVRGMVVSIGSPSMVMVQAVGKNLTGKVNTAPVKVNLDAKTVKANQTVFLTLDKQDDKGAWNVKSMKTE